MVLLDVVDTRVKWLALRRRPRRARAEGAGGHKLRMPSAQGAQDADNTATDARPMSEPSEAQSSTPWPDTSSMTNKERKAYFKAARVTTLDPPRAEKRAKAE